MDSQDLPPPHVFSSSPRYYGKKHFAHWAAIVFSQPLRQVYQVFRENRCFFIYSQEVQRGCAGSFLRQSQTDPGELAAGKANLDRHPGAHPVLQPRGYPVVKGAFHWQGHRHRGKERRT